MAEAEATRQRGRERNGRDVEAKEKEECVRSVLAYTRLKRRAVSIRFSEAIILLAINTALARRACWICRDARYQRAVVCAECERLAWSAIRDVSRRYPMCVG